MAEAADDTAAAYVLANAAEAHRHTAAEAHLSLDPVDTLAASHKDSAAVERSGPAAAGDANSNPDHCYCCTSLSQVAADRNQRYSSLTCAADVPQELTVEHYT